MTDEPVALRFQIALEFGNVGFMGRGENRSTRRKPLAVLKDKNQQQTQPTYDAESGNRTQATLGGECSHHCAIPDPRHCMEVNNALLTFSTTLL